MIKINTIRATAHVLLVLAAMLGFSLVKAETDPPVLVLQSVHIVPLDDAPILRDQQVLVEGNRIAGVYDANWQAPDQAQRIDGQGGYLIPGLNELHAHVPSSQHSEQYLDDTLFLYLSNGITRIRGMLGEPMHLALREELASGKRLGPLLITSGPSINGRSVPNKAKAFHVVAEQAAAGYDFLKIHPGLEREVFDAMAQAARLHNIRFAGHVPGAVGLDRALQAPYSSIDHLDQYIEWMARQSGHAQSPEGFFGYLVGPEVDEQWIERAAEASAEAGVWNVPTETLMHNVLLLDPDEIEAQRPEFRYMPREIIDNWINRVRQMQQADDYNREAAEAFARHRLALINALQRAGAPIMLGSDAPQIFNVPGFSIHHEIELMQRAGLSEREILYSATVAPAQYFGKQHTAGRIAEGFEANLVLLERNPLDNLENLKSPLGVIVAGRWLSREDIDAGLEAIAERNQVGTR